MCPIIFWIVIYYITIYNSLFVWHSQIALYIPEEATQKQESKAAKWQCKVIVRHLKWAESIWYNRTCYYFKWILEYALSNTVENTEFHVHVYDTNVVNVPTEN